MPRPYREVRKDYILARADAILRGSAGRMSRQDAKEAACREFDELFQHQLQISTAEISAERDRLRTELVTQRALDTSGSASVQHYIDTGHYLPATPRLTADEVADGLGIDWQSAYTPTRDDIVRAIETDRAMREDMEEAGSDGDG